MRDIIGALTVICIGIAFPALVEANPICGTEPKIKNQTLQNLIDTVAGNLSKSTATPDEVKSAIISDLSKFEAINDTSDKDAIRSRYFYAACKTQMHHSQNDKSQLRIAYEKLKPFAEAVAVTPEVQRVMERLKNGLEPATVQSVGPRGQSPEVAAKTSARRSARSKARTAKPLVPVHPSPKARNRGFNTNAAVRTTEERRNSECEKMGVLGTDNCVDFESVVKNLKQAPLAYNHPKSMYLGKRTQISLVIKTGQDDHKKELEGLPGKVISGETKISRIMQAELSGSDFKIEPSGRQSRTITSLAPVKWTWFVTPLEVGKQKRLNLELSAILREGARDLPPVTIRTFSTQIEVDVRWWDLIIHRVSAFDPIYQLATALGGLATVLLLIWRLMSWSRRKTVSDP